MKLGIVWAKDNVQSPGTGPATTFSFSSLSPSVRIHEAGCCTTFTAQWQAVAAACISHWQRSRVKKNGNAQIIVLLKKLSSKPRQISKVEFKLESAWLHVRGGWCQSARWTRKLNIDNPLLPPSKQLVTRCTEMVVWKHKPCHKRFCSLLPSLFLPW